MALTTEEAVAEENTSKPRQAETTRVASQLWMRGDDA